MTHPANAPGLVKKPVKDRHDPPPCTRTLQDFPWKRQDGTQGHARGAAACTAGRALAVRQDHAAAEDGHGHAVALVQLLQLHLARPLGAAVPARRRARAPTSAARKRACMAPGRFQVLPVMQSQEACTSVEAVSAVQACRGARPLQPGPCRALYSTSPSSSGKLLAIAHRSHP